MSTCQLVKVSKMSICQLVIKFQISRSVKCHEVINFLSSFQELLVFFAIICLLFGIFLYFCQFWHCLATFGILWQLFAIFLQLLPGFDSLLWAIFRHVLAAFDNSWKIWLFLATVGKFKLLWADFNIFASFWLLS